jgi:LysM repeat protein
MSKPNGTAPKTKAPQVYVVQQGDSLWKISRRFGVSVETLKSYNQLKSDSIKPGDTLKIP